ncbi:hypothetical protein PFICI_10175 [Pestalotiopsis fici W106-1]|uniref:Vegetative cell wall protein gp1 n=1 Tax=Pestalotiopsis fici (strain W106-1 / CGMCC3.15140) TaxID=1229662 RepID=W3WW58_PESFW|nr:uncharacterized protein PFICI_10175 [Pestalotiopsis fici W106-1]ETS78113.1 hypothetical protein PFICI_10175 [Pestalotiopsis fici W106-1]
MASYYYGDQYTPSPTPSPMHNPRFSGIPPQRPQTAAHSHHRNVSSSVYASPRYNSKGEYGTQADAGPSPRVSSRKHSFSKPKHSHHQTPKRERRSSYSYYRTSYGDSDEDEIVEVDGVTYVLPAQSRGRRYHEYYNNAAAGYGTDYHYYKQGYQGQYYDVHGHVYYDEPIQRSATRVSHSRRASGTVPLQRPQTVKPERARQSQTHPPKPRAATRQDAEKHGIPLGYSLKHWDPTEEPIMLLGSVFDSNSLGKWIYDWTVCCHSAGSPLANVAGDLWLSLIQLSGKIKRAEEAIKKVRRTANKELLDDFIVSGERLQDKLRAILKRCEAPMLEAGDRDGGSLGKGSGSQFVETLFTVGREFEKVERFMTQTRLWNLRFDANCTEILKYPTQ